MTASLSAIGRSAPTAELARQFVAKNRLSNVEIINADAAATGLPSASFDLVHARLVLLGKLERLVNECLAQHTSRG